jgi:transcriptional regulator with XRE-family HTH domain
MEKIYEIVGRRVREERKHLKITQERLAEFTNLSVAFIGQIERGDNRASLLTVQKIADALRILPSKLFVDVPASKATKSEYKLTEQIEALMRDKTPREKIFARELLKFIFSKRSPEK